MNIANLVKRKIWLWNQYGIAEPEYEYKFHPVRKWRFDIAFPAQRLAVEIEGGAWAGGRHTRGAGFIGDVAKYNSATELGWRLLRFTPQTFDYRIIRRTLDNIANNTF